MFIEFLSFILNSFEFIYLRRTIKFKKLNSELIKKYVYNLIWLLYLYM